VPLSKVTRRSETSAPYARTWLFVELRDRGNSENLANCSEGTRGFASVCRVEDSKVNALTRAIGVRDLEKSPRSLKADAVDHVLCRHVSCVPCHRPA
jgi:hypothetical protein